MRPVNKPVYQVGRGLQVAGLAVTPYSLWVGFLGHNEAGSITIFLGSIAIFYLGYLLTQWGTKI